MGALEAGLRGWVPLQPWSPCFPTGLKLQGATCTNNKLSLSNAISTVLPLTQLRWVKQTNAEKKANVVSTIFPVPWLCQGLYLPGNDFTTALTPAGASYLQSESQQAPFSVPQVTLPVYLNFTRADLIFTVDFEIATKEDPRSFYERGVAVLCTE